jgi:hypothetical protein
MFINSGPIDKYYLFGDPFENQVIFIDQRSHFQKNNKKSAQIQIPNPTLSQALT